ncbi:MAG: GAF domain-containing sensor histidine kinase [Acidimicrobiia bacterium]|nr:GAF domain-containing sensor histidine kinase [Acidimicrobiia bacterium]
MVSSSQQPTPAAQESSGGAVGALRAVRQIWLDSLPDTAKARSLSPGATASLTAVLAALRWGAAMIGLAWAAGRAAEGVLGVVVTLAVAIFITSWRTITPIRFGEPGVMPLLKAVGDVAAMAIAIGLSDGLNGAFVGSLFVTVAVAGFGWGISIGVLCALLSVVLSLTTSVVFGISDGIPYPGPLAVTALAAAAILPGIAVDRLADIEERRRALLDQRNRLAETNQLLELLTDLARTLPSSLDLNDVLQATRDQLAETFQASRVAILAYEDGTWSPQYQDGFDIPPQVGSALLPAPLGRAVGSTEPLLVEDLSDDHDREGSGLYTRLTVSGIDIGLLAVEHTEPGEYREADAELLGGMSDVLALTLANARSFRRLRSLAAAEERSRIARDLHDRLGQYLTYIALELERINNDREQPSPDLKELHGEVQGAISEFRDSLIELRAAVTPDRPLTVVLSEVVERFRNRSTADVSLVVPGNLARLPAIVENELLRIAQEALVNIEKHSFATEVHIAWTIADGCGVLVLEDDGRGFDPAKGIRGSAYGLVGMRERAASVGAMLDIASAPGEGTVITVQTTQTSEQVTKP